jgi:fibronectin type 3 domain-containing protein
VLTSPQEENVKRSEVLFIAERNPSGLAGTPGTDRIDLKWYTPYNPVKHYRLYMSEKGRTDFRTVAESRRTSHTVRDLRSNTAYLFMVTAIDKRNEESLPSNELELMTKNIRPNPPGEITAVKSAPSADGKITATLRWQAATDDDGKIAGYSVYRHKEQGKKREAKVAGTEYTARGLVPTVRNRFEITSVDDRGD